MGNAQSHHTVENTAMHGFEAVAHVGQSAGYDYGHRIVNVRGLHFLLDIDFDDSIVDCFHLIFVGVVICSDKNTDLFKVTLYFETKKALFGANDRRKGLLSAF